MGLNNWQFNPGYTMQSFLLSVGEKFTPLLKESKFSETGRLTPDEVLLMYVWYNFLNITSSLLPVTF